MPYLSSFVQSTSLHSLTNLFLNVYSSRGVVAGDILLHTVQLEKYGYGGSVNKAVFLLELIYKESETHDGQSVPCNPTSIRNAWATYKSVAHLWAAKRGVADYFFSEKGLSQEPAAFLTPEFQEYNFTRCYDELPIFLAMAECFRQFGIQHVPRGQKSPILPPDETWSCAGAIPLRIPRNSATQSAGKLALGHF